MAGQGARSGSRVRNPRGEGQRLREQIVAAATEIIEQTGDVDQLSLRAVARRIGITAPSIYQHFPDGDDLKVAVVEQCFAAFAKVRDEAAPPPGDPTSQPVASPMASLLARCHAYCQFALDHPGPYRFMFSHRVPRPHAPTVPAGMAALRALAASIRACQQASQQASQQNGPPGDTHEGQDLDPPGVDDDPERLAVQVWAALHGLVLLRMNLPQFPWPLSLSESVEETVRRLVAPATPRSFTPLDTSRSQP